MVKLKNKKLIIIISIFCIVSLIGILLFLYFNNKVLEVSDLEVLEPLRINDSAEAVKRVRDNVVKISNKLDANNVIYGTGFFDKSGYLITNSHVVDIKGDISVIYTDGFVSKAYLVSNDILSDLAILSVKDVKVKALPLVSTLNLEVTDSVFAIGYQLNLEGDASVVKGIISAKRVASGIEFLQTDAAVNSGGSGGPVINAKGEVVGITTLASDNATLSFAISSDTLDLYISKLINNKSISYITSKRDVNALSSVLKEVNYLETDIYEEEKYLKRFDKNEDKNDDDKDREDNKEEHLINTDSNNSNGNSDSNSTDNTNRDEVNNNEIKEEKYEKIYIKITPVEQIVPVLVNGQLSNKISDYFYLESELTNCKLDLSLVDVSKVGTYPVNVNCTENSASAEIVVYGTVEPNYIAIPDIVMDETKNNVVSFEQIKGTWYYPGYRDTCTVFSYNRGIYDWSAYSYNPYSGKLYYNYGGGSSMDTLEKLLSSAKFWVQGDFLVITTDGAQYTLTRKKGVGVYDERYYFDSFCD